MAVKTLSDAVRARGLRFALWLQSAPAQTRRKGWRYILTGPRGELSYEVESSRVHDIVRSLVVARWELFMARFNVDTAYGLLAYLGKASDPNCTQSGNQGLGYLDMARRVLHGAASRRGAPAFVTHCPWCSLLGDQPRAAECSCCRCAAERAGAVVPGR